MANKKGLHAWSPLTCVCGGERGIRTPGRFPVNGFQDRRFRPLSQLSVVYSRRNPYGSTNNTTDQEKQP